MKNYLTCLLFPFIIPLLNAQQTVGIFLNEPNAFNGYTLFGNNKHTYLIDNCGKKINEWVSDAKPGLSKYLLENGDLLRTVKVSGDFSGGGIGGGFELFNWEGDLIWSFEYNDNDFHAHHDIEPLPNGNFLAIAWEKHNSSEAQQNGRMYSGEVWSERIVEFKPIGNNQANIVWEWRLWDHLIQDHDPSDLNYGSVSNHPELIDINFLGSNEDPEKDWIHLNAIDYNVELDQIAVSSRNFGEIWIIDHSTSTTQAAGHSGGNYGKGGDLLYRFGNPQAYKRGGADDQVFFNQHDIRWIDTGLPKEGNLMVFNNDAAPNTSSVIIWSAPELSNEGYYLEEGEAYGPESFDWEYSTAGFYSDIMSGAQMLPNGNVLICEAEDGRFFEITEEEEWVWEYINPVNQNGNPVSQGGTIHFNEVFRATKYAPDYPGFEGKDLTPGVPVEINPWDLECEIYDSPVGIAYISNEKFISIINNPFEMYLGVEIKETNALIPFEIFNTIGERVKKGNLEQGRNWIEMEGLTNGIYYLNISLKEKGQKSFKIIKT